MHILSDPAFCNQTVHRLELTVSHIVTYFRTTLSGFTIRKQIKVKSSVTVKWSIFDPQAIIAEGADMQI